MVALIHQFKLRLNPVNSLFGRIFLWFWLATILLISSTIWLAKQLMNEVEILPASQQSIELLDYHVRKLEQHLLERSDADESLNYQLKKYAHTRGVTLMLVDVDSKEFIYAMPPPMRPDSLLTLRLIALESKLNIRATNIYLTGSQTIQIDDQNYEMFIGKPRPLSWLFETHKSDPRKVLLAAIVLSGFFCFVLTGSLVKPIRRLQEAVRSMSQGKLGARIDTKLLRSDELGELGREFNKMSSQVQKNMHSQKRMFADISHELRSPLARQQIAVGTIRKLQGNQTTPKVAQLLDRIEKEAEQIDQMLGQLLHLAKFDITTNIEKRDIELNSLLLPLVTDAQFEAESSNKTLDFLCPEATSVHVNSAMLSSAVENILRNAVRYAKKEVRFSVSVLDDQIEMEIRDDGCGLSEEAMQHIFEPFYRESESRERKSGGIGLGLAIAQQAIKLHEGIIETRKVDVGGLLIKISLPLN